MVWIHGGSFSFGSGNIDYSGFHYLVGENVVVVTINFRLNILGFLNLRNEKVPGNAGFKDQVQALKWVKENIAYFGGDPNKVTLAGERLFHQAISESGSCLAPYAFKERTDNIAFSVGEKLGYSTKDKDELLKHLMNSSPEQLVTTTNEFYNMGKGAMIEVPFTPTADRDSPAGDICIPDNPANLVKSGQYKSVPYITGFNSAEGILLVNGIKNTAVKNIEGTLESFSCEDFGIEEDNCNRKEIARKINEHYFTNSSDLKMKAESFINFTTDIYFLNQAYCSIRKMTPHFKAPIYMYEFSFTGNNLMYKKLFNGEEFPGAAHVEELAYMQYNTYKYQPNSRELLTSKRLNRLWGNFIKTG
ncbi:Juvenile hormone esterase [Blattella germanica]|nr:Juvenile hormone esterase [Blattella germanica]